MSVPKFRTLSLAAHARFLRLAHGLSTAFFARRIDDKHATCPPSTGLDRVIRNSPLYHYSSDCTRAIATPTDLHPSPLLIEAPAAFSSSPHRALVTPGQSCPGNTRTKLSQIRAEPRISFHHKRRRHLQGELLLARPRRSAIDTNK